MTDTPKDVLDTVADKVSPRDKASTASDAKVKSPNTRDGLPVEGQLRKGWNPDGNGGLPTP